MAAEVGWDFAPLRALWICLGGGGYDPCAVGPVESVAEEDFQVYGAHAGFEPDIVSGNASVGGAAAFARGPSD